MSRVEKMYVACLDIAKEQTGAGVLALPIRIRKRISTPGRPFPGTPDIAPAKAKQAEYNCHAGEETNYGF